jgi:hypothetical protein
MRSIALLAIKNLFVELSIGGKCERLFRNSIEKGASELNISLLDGIVHEIGGILQA